MSDILFIDIDSTIPNLALMKLARYHINKGDNVFLKKCNNPDKVYISCIFENNVNKALGIKKLFDCPVEIGGYFIDKNKVLPYEIEHLKPYYNLYSDCNASYGYTMRGCCRACPFCIVSKKEGKPKIVGDIYEFLDRRFKKIVVMDNNIFCIPKHFIKIANQIYNENLKVDFNSGLDVRLMTDEIAIALKKLNTEDKRFAWDLMQYSEQVLRGCDILLKHNIKGCMFYVLVGYNTSFEDDIKRVNILTKKYKMRPYIMRYKDCFKTKESSRKYNLLFEWVNGGHYHVVMSFEKFLKLKKNKQLGNEKKILFEKSTLENY